MLGFRNDQYAGYQICEVRYDAQVRQRGRTSASTPALKGKSGVAFVVAPPKD
jgi:hypothetical protein